MKVLMVTPSFYPIVGGTETNVWKITWALNKNNIHADIMTFNMNTKWKPIWKEEKYKINNINIFKISALNLFSNLRINPLEKIIKINNIPNYKFLHKIVEYDLIHFHDDIDLSFPLFSILMEKPKVFHIRTLTYTYNSYKLNPLSRLIFTNIADKYISNSSYNKELLMKLGIPSKKINVLPNFVDINMFKPNPNKKIDNLILFVGRPVIRKGLHVLLHSLKYIDIPLHLIIICPYSNNNYFKNILTTIKKINNFSIHKVEYIGKIINKKLPEWYQKSSIFVCPSLGESFGTVNIEALSCGTPVVASNVGGIPDIIKNGINGILVPPNNSVELAKAIKKLLINEDLRIKYGKQGRTMVEKYFSMDYMTKEIIKIYKSLL
ncbi:MAG: glycosyltransferase family 4 protein [Candidatus Hodarchaeota archaeon]